MDFKKKSLLKIFSLFVWAGLLVVAPVAGAADEGYDEDAFGPAQPIVFNAPAPGVFFEHKIHTQVNGLECDSCHDNLFEMEAGAAEAKSDFTMKSFAAGKYCGACHDGNTAFDAGSQCLSCHMQPKDVIIFTKPVKAVIFDHKSHTDNGLECGGCHSEIFMMKTGTAESKVDFTMTSLYEGKYCGACHDGGTAFASNSRCTVCHIGVKGYNRTQGGGTGEKDAGH